MLARRPSCHLLYLPLKAGGWGRKSPTQQTGEQHTAFYSNALQSILSHSMEREDTITISADRGTATARRPSMRLPERTGTAPPAATGARREATSTSSSRTAHAPPDNGRREGASDERERTGANADDGYTPEIIDAVIEEISEKLDDEANLRANVVRARRLWAASPLSVYDFVYNVLYPAMSNTKQQEGVRRRGAYFFSVVQETIGADNHTDAPRSRHHALKPSEPRDGPRTMRTDPTAA